MLDGSFYHEAHCLAMSFLFFHENLFFTMGALDFTVFFGICRRGLFFFPPQGSCFCHEAFAFVMAVVGLYIILASEATSRSCFKFVILNFSCKQITIKIEPIIF